MDLHPPPGRSGFRTLLSSFASMMRRSRSGNDLFQSFSTTKHTATAISIHYGFQTTIHPCPSRQCFSMNMTRFMRTSRSSSAPSHASGLVSARFNRPCSRSTNPFCGYATLSLGRWMRKASKESIKSRAADLDVSDVYRFVFASVRLLFDLVRRPTGFGSATSHIRLNVRR